MPWSPGQLASVLIGAAFVAAGLVLMALERFGEPPDGTHGGGVRRWWGGRSVATRYLLAGCMVIGGYHVAAWALPPHWPILAVPRERWWLVAAGIAAAVVGALLLDRAESGRG